MITILNYIKEIRNTIYIILSILLIVNINVLLDFNLAQTISSLLYINFLIILVSLIFIIKGYIDYKKKIKEFISYINGSYYSEGNVFCENIYETIDNKFSEYKKEIEDLKYELQEINDYMTNWIHQVKIPIAILEIMSQRIKEIGNNNVHKEISIEIKRIESLVNQALYISRSGNYSSDFIIEEVNLQRIIKDIIKKNKHLFIYKHIELEIEDIDINILTDKKWILHIIEQILDNACKYSNLNGLIKIYTVKNKKSIQLHIKDNGVGISKGDIKRVFDKGFTGENGRNRTKSTGMGLYISKKILNKLSHDISIDSDINEFCDVYITFYNLSDYFNVT